jgi:hypothetical protein
VGANLNAASAKKEKVTKEMKIKNKLTAWLSLMNFSLLYIFM